MSGGKTKKERNRVVNILIEYAGLTLIFLVIGLIIAFAFGGF